LEIIGTAADAVVVWFCSLNGTSRIIRSDIIGEDAVSMGISKTRNTIQETNKDETILDDLRIKRE
jgi:hypothetical protein